MFSSAQTALTRRSLLLAAPAALLAAKGSTVRVGCETNAWTVDPRNFDSLLEVLASIKTLGFEGFETGFINLRSQFEKPGNAYDRLKKTGLKFFGVHLALSTYDPQTAIARNDLLQVVADGSKALGAERLIVSGDSTVHPLALRAKADALNKIAKYCKGIGLGCAYHNHEVEFREKGAQIDGLLSQTDPNLHFVLNSGYAMAAGANVAEFFARNSKRIDGIHLRDARGGQDTSLGEGEYDFAPLAKEIQTSGWKGWLLIGEDRRKGDQPVAEAVRLEREALHRIFGA